MLMESPKKLVPKFFEKTAKSYDKVVTWTTFRQDKYWKKEILKKIPSVNAVLDLACGTGILTRLIANVNPNAKIVGVDIMQNYLDVAKTNSQKYDNITFLNQDAEKLDLDLKFDCITSSYLPKYCNTETLVKVCIKHLKDDGQVIFHDFIYPRNSFMKNLWELYFAALNFIGIFIPSWKEVFRDLPKLIRSTNWLDDYEKTMADNGLQTEQKFLTIGSSAILVGKKIS
ncbi:MAG: methyltransferase domain-containing protein [Thaumarchaeota archaeon]|nr:methyltransferase domain-containing protein [Nitrososphaerota archaeon]